ncbi:MAG: hypothetical protein ACYCXK_05550 [Candidatus Humimicrobiaceae bacterium]
MNNDAKLYNYGKLPAISLISGLLSLGIFTFTKIIKWTSTLPFSDNLNLNIGLSITGIIGICLPIIAIICGNIDLKRIKKGLHKNKVFKGLDITGILLGSIVLFIVAFFIAGDLLLSDR